MIRACIAATVIAMADGVPVDCSAGAAQPMASSKVHGFMSHRTLPGTNVRTSEGKRSSSATAR